jgi:hypothetical protein
MAGDTCSADFIHPKVGSWDIGDWADDEIECDQCLGPCMYEPEHSIGASTCRCKRCVAEHKCSVCGAWHLDALASYLSHKAQGI